MNQAVLDRYRCPEEYLDWKLTGTLSEHRGFFGLGSEVRCYGHVVNARLVSTPEEPRYDVLQDLGVSGACLDLSFDPTEIIHNFQLERYVGKKRTAQRLLKSLYYVVRPFMGVAVRSVLQKFRARNWEKASFPSWPVDTTVEDVYETLLLLTMKSKGIDEIPFIWFWPRGASACVAMTHDVETETGRAFCDALMDMNDSFEVKSSFQVIPERRYEVSPQYLEDIRSRGFEVAVHDLYHDGRLYDKETEFLRRAKKINYYLRNWSANGFRAGALYRNVDWFKFLDMSYDMSIPNVGHLDPQSGGCCTVMPYFVGTKLEIPLTAVQDYMLFHIIHQYSIDLWVQQIQMIMGKNGLVSFIVHPDYIIEPRARSVYLELLKYLDGLRSRSNLWIALPGEIDKWWRLRHDLRLRKDGETWRIEGKGAELAQIAYARNVAGKIIYEVPTVPATA